jgi:cation transport ATPase
VRHRLAHPARARGHRPSYTRPVFTPLTLSLAVAALALAAWCGWAAYRDQPTKDWHFIGMAVVTLLALVQLVVGVVRLAGGAEADEGTVIFVAYLAAVVACVPVVGVMSLTERTRWGSLTVTAGAVVLAVLQVRLHDIWGGGHGA